MHHVGYLKRFLAVSDHHLPLPDSRVPFIHLFLSQRDWNGRRLWKMHLEMNQTQANQAMSLDEFVHSN